MITKLINHFRNALPRYNNNIYAIADLSLMEDDNAKQLPFILVEFGGDVVDEPDKGLSYIQNIEDIYICNIFLPTLDRVGTKPSHDIETIRQEIFTNVINHYIDGKPITYKGLSVVNADRNETHLQITLSIKHQLTNDNTGIQPLELDEFKEVSGTIKHKPIHWEQR